MSHSSSPSKERELRPKRYKETKEIKEVAPLDERDAQLVNSAQRCLHGALDYSRARKIKLLSDGERQDDPVIELPPAALRVIARVLALMGERKPLVVFHREHELTTQEVAGMLNVSRPFVIKEIAAGRLKCHMAGSHRRVAYEEMVRYRDAMRADQDMALQELADQAQELGMGYK